jgi:hypothetical protein
MLSKITYKQRKSLACHDSFKIKREISLNAFLILRCETYFPVDFKNHEVLEVNSNTKAEKEVLFIKVIIKQNERPAKGV